jgi:hypothetical protein
MMVRKLASVAALACLVAACGQGAPPSSSTGPEAAGANSNAGYEAPPQVLSVTASAGGGFVIRGRAGPEARIRAVTPDQKAYGATAGRDGGFSLDVPAIGGPALISLSTESGRHPIESEGWLFVPPDAPARAVLLKPGAPARSFDATGGPIGALDYDAGGGASVSGLTTPNMPVSVSLDGGTPVKTRADARGAYGVRLGGDKPVAPGEHEVRVTVGDQTPGTPGSSLKTTTRRMQFVAGAAASLSGGAFSAQREPEGWRVVWAPPGGRQTTFVPVGPPRS